MISVAVTQRVVLAHSYSERRDALDQRWTAFLLACGILPVMIPNNLDAARLLASQCGAAGLLLTGGNDLASCGGDAPERDRVETWLLESAMARDEPVLGVCRGMQLIQHYFGFELKPVEGHVTPSQTIRMHGRPYTTNSYHTWGSTSQVPDMENWAVADDGVVKAIRHRERRVAGFMWHPERLSPFTEDDIVFVRRFFGAGSR